MADVLVSHGLQSFADAVIEVLSDARESDDVDKTLDAANKVINEFWVGWALQWAGFQHE